MVQFPYALKALPAIVQEKWDDPEFIHFRDEFPPDARQSPASLLAHVEDLTAKDVKISYLKNLQGVLMLLGDFLAQSVKKEHQGISSNANHFLQRLSLANRI